MSNSYNETKIIPEDIIKFCEKEGLYGLKSYGSALKRLWMYLRSDFSPNPYKEIYIENLIQRWFNYELRKTRNKIEKSTILVYSSNLRTIIMNTVIPYIYKQNKLEYEKKQRKMLEQKRLEQERIEKENKRKELSEMIRQQKDRMIAINKEWDVCRNCLQDLEHRLSKLS